MADMMVCHFCWPKMLARVSRPAAACDVSSPASNQVLLSEYRLILHIVAKI